MFYRGAIVMVDKKEIGMEPLEPLEPLGALGALEAFAWFGLVLVLGKNT